MTDFSTISDGLVDVCFAQLGDAATFTPTQGAAVATRALVFHTTRVAGEFGIVEDPRKSIELPTADVGKYPRGSVAVGDDTYALGRIVDAPVSARGGEGVNSRRSVLLWCELQ